MCAVISDPRHTQCTRVSQKQDRCHIYVIIKILCLLGYHHYGSVISHVICY